MSFDSVVKTIITYGFNIFFLVVTIYIFFKYIRPSIKKRFEIHRKPTKQTRSEIENGVNPERKYE